ncbi:hypothetical protein FCOIX_8292 [Fusarium coicis]|nr:hypothetical protein FCOIX_8292 [Fusarium coicis]
MVQHYNRALLQHHVLASRIENSPIHQTLKTPGCELAIPVGQYRVTYITRDRRGTISKLDPVFRIAIFDVQPSTSTDKADDKWNVYSQQLQIEIDAFVISRSDWHLKESRELIASI